MRELPLGHPGTPDLRSPTRFLLWVARGQLGTLALGMVYGVVWMAALAVVPALVGRAIDLGVAEGDTAGLLRWSALILAAGLVSAVAGILRHRVAVVNWLTAAYRVQQLLVRQAVRLGASLPRRVPTGEVAAVGTHDAERVGSVMDVVARLAGAVASFVVVAVLMLGASTNLGLVVAVGVPLLSAAIGPLLRPLHRRRARHRELVGALTTVGADTVSGLRVLRGIGGEEVFSRRYAAASQEVRGAGVAAAGVQSVLDAAEVALTGVFVVAVTWLGARLALAGRISVGELIAFYGYAAFLLLPVRTVTEAADKFTRALVAARRTVQVLALEPELASGSSAAEPPAGAALVDGPSGLVVEAGELTAVVAGVPEHAAAIADRLGRFADGDGVWLGGIALRDLPLEVVRRRVLVSEHDPRLFTGRLADSSTRPARPRPTGCWPRSTPPRPPTSWRRCPTGWPPRSPSAAGPSRAASASGWCWPAPWSPTPRSWSWSSRPAPSTPTPRPASPTGWWPPARAGPPWSAPPARCCWTAPTRSRWWWTAGSSPRAATASCWMTSRATARS